MQLSKRENAGFWIGVISAVIPAIVVAGFLPDFNVLPCWAWVVIAAIGSGLAGVVASDKLVIGAVSGGIAGLGLVIGVIGYVELRTSILQTENFLRIEIAIGALIGAAPGLIAYWKFAKSNG